MKNALNAVKNPSYSFITKLNQGYDQNIVQYLTILKPKVMSLAVFTALCGMTLAPGKIHPFIGFNALFYIAMGAGAAGCLNMWWEKDIDQKMYRTKNRPIVTGKIEPDSALAIGFILSVISVGLLTITTNLWAGLTLLLTISAYFFLYTILLKPRTSQSIVWGGISGALPPLVGWLCVNQEINYFPLIMVLIIFFWTPPHFWALAIFALEDFGESGLPIMPVSKGIQYTKKLIVTYSVIMIIISFLPYIIGYSGQIYLGICTTLNIIWIVMLQKLYVNKDKTVCLKFFIYSIFYLFFIFMGLILDHFMVKIYG